MAEEIRYDVEGYELVTEALRNLINSYPNLQEGDAFGFAQIPEGDGKAIFPSSGAVIQSERESITGHVEQMCAYPFTVVYKASGLNQKNKVNVKEWMDNFGRWLEKQKVKIGEQYYVIAEYPVLVGDRKIRSISRITPAYLSTVNANMSEEWIMEMQVLYRNEFDK